jgi:chromosome segregation ATPase
MKKIAHLTLAELLKLKDEYEFPDTLREDAIKRGIESELEEREGIRAKEIEKLNEQLNDLRADLSRMDEEAARAGRNCEKLEEDAAEKDEQINELKGKLADARDEISELRAAAFAGAQQ